MAFFLTATFAIFLCILTRGSVCVLARQAHLFLSPPPASNKMRTRDVPKLWRFGREVGSPKGLCLSEFFCLNVFSSPACVSSTFGNKAKVMKEERVVGQSELRRPWGLLNSSFTNEQLVFEPRSPLGLNFLIFDNNQRPS